ncbi:hypothetical protein CPter291_2927 [Collimonas pratensis]|uniref:Uncharacterized protein n=1 Tax=Collimonas pratensis TaxID=279113 RepID=A0A127QYM8_9BURK|nr:hypothetical protein CPter91_2417 [Collimonas pratensis]AMP15179.1 hypothetical protein CPter291_2927 [Collimonas pratensis]
MLQAPSASSNASGSAGEIILETVRRSLELWILPGCCELDASVFWTNNIIPLIDLTWVNGRRRHLAGAIL